MVKLEMSKVLEQEVTKMATVEGYDSVQKYILDKIVLMVVNELTTADVVSTQKKIDALQKDLNTKRDEIHAELRGESSGKDK